MFFISPPQANAVIVFYRFSPLTFETKDGLQTMTLTTHRQNMMKHWNVVCIIVVNTTYSIPDIYKQISAINISSISYIVKINKFKKYHEWRCVKTGRVFQNFGDRKMDALEILSLKMYEKQCNMNRSRNGYFNPKMQ